MLDARLLLKPYSLDDLARKVRVVLDEMKTAAALKAAAVSLMPS